MRITKFGHCCLLIQEKDLCILTDPGDYNDTPDVSGIDLILLTHEHKDHLYIPSLQKILEKNSGVRIITHQSVGAILDAEKIPHTLLGDKKEIIFKDVAISSFGTTHACIHHDLPKVQNTGFMIAHKLFYPGDSLDVPGEAVEILALPVAGPWLTLEDVIEYAKAVHPKVVFPVHDGMLRQDRLGSTRAIPPLILAKIGIEYVDMTDGAVKDF